MPKHTPPGTLAAQAYSRIRDKILRGDLPLGAAISRRKLAEDFHMSFLPISEAIQRLEHDGLVESLRRAGTRVRIPTPRDICERHILREALEVQSARLFVEKASAEERMELRGMAAQLDAMVAEAAEEPPGAEFLFRLQTYHLSFHMRIAECTGCAALCESLEKNQVLIFNWLYDTASQHRMPPGGMGNCSRRSRAATRMRPKRPCAGTCAMASKRFRPRSRCASYPPPPPSRTWKPGAPDRARRPGRGSGG